MGQIKVDQDQYEVKTITQFVSSDLRRVVNSRALNDKPVSLAPRYYY